MSNVREVDKIVQEPTSGYIPTVPTRTYELDTLGEASKSIPAIFPVQPTRPVLSPPEDVIILSESDHEIKIQEFAASIVTFLDLLTDIEGLYIKHLESELNTSKTTMANRLSTHNTEQREIEKSINSASWWDSIRLFSLVSLGVVSMFVGGAVISTATTTFELVTGGGLLLSGGLTVGSNALLETKNHKDLANALAIWGSIIGLIAGTAHMLTTTQTFAKFAGDLAIAALSVSSNLATMGREEWSRVTETLRAKNALTQKELEKIRFLMDLMTREAPHFIEMLTRNQEEVSRIQLRHEKNIQRIIAYSGPLSAA